MTDFDPGPPPELCGPLAPWVGTAVADARRGPIHALTLARILETTFGEARDARVSADAAALARWLRQSAARHPDRPTGGSPTG